jgi:hypothetical protein
MSKKFNPQELALAPLQELAAQHESLTSYIERERRKGRDHHELEIEACYLYREIEYRHQVTRAHEAWLATRGPSEESDFEGYEEESYPDFQN